MAEFISNSAIPGSNRPHSMLISGRETGPTPQEMADLYPKSAIVRLSLQRSCYVQLR